MRELTPEEEGVLEQAEQLLLRECMEIRGFEYQITSADMPAEYREFRYVIDDPEWAAEHGYGSGLQREVSEMRENDPNQRYFENLPRERRVAALRAANGPSPVGVTATAPDGMEFSRSDKGCQSYAERELYGDLHAWFQARTTVDALPGMVYQRVVDDPRYQEASRTWSECMADAGHDHATPAELRLTLPPPEDPLPEAEEVRLALAEARCAVGSGLGESVAELEEHHVGELRRQYRSATDTRRRLQLNALPRARSVVEEAERAAGRH